MNFHLTTIVFLVFDQINKILTQGVPISPCPKMFQYRFDGAEWFGIMSLQNPDIGQVLNIKVTLSMRGKPTTNYLGEIELLTRGQFQVDTPVLYKIKFPKNPYPPKLIQIAANNQIVCVGAADLSIFVTQIQLEHTRKFTFIPSNEEFIPPSALHPPQLSPQPSSTSTQSLPSKMSGPGAAPSPFLETFDTKFLPFAANEKHLMKQTRNICGRTGENRPRLSIGGIEIQTSGEEDFNDEETLPAAASSSLMITRGAWPWLAAIYVNNLTSLAYQCGGTLISSRIVISSAHCFHTNKRKYSPNEVLVFLGRHNLKNWSEEGSLAASCDDIFIHPDYDSQLKSYDADIAVVVLKSEVRYNAFIRPACMWSSSTDSQYIEGERGIVVGWGAAATSASSSGGGAHSRNLTSLTATPRVIAAPIVSNEVCFKSNDKFRSLSSNRTFCAGSRNSNSSPCRGDSGAGLMIFKNNRWMLRGTVSASLPSGSYDNESSCNTNEYVIYTDVAKFLDWIFAFII
ncbi:serine protease gd [Episyrphus balteatus]|uniref:serine protease gd n=1 Tax=Episyrphus balteatus TaxID=286459 RepID=UPI002486B730|nr:serine protease gd [Episyrphus balteatus]